MAALVVSGDCYQLSSLIQGWYLLHEATAISIEPEPQALPQVISRIADAQICLFLSIMPSQYWDVEYSDHYPVPVYPTSPSSY